MSTVRWLIQQDEYMKKPLTICLSSGRRTEARILPQGSRMNGARIGRLVQAVETAPDAARTPHQVLPRTCIALLTSNQVLAPVSPPWCNIPVRVSRTPSASD